MSLTVTVTNVMASMRTTLSKGCQDMRGLYVHIPFCVQKCSYCDFVSFTCGEKDAYLGALEDEFDSWRGERIDSVFIGGGTPTSLDAKQLERLLCCINTRFDVKGEFTIEANPKTLDCKKLDVLKSGGVNRISVGVQSFNDIELKSIGRIHNADDAKRTISLIHDCGFDNVSIDLMSALPNQTLKSFRQTLDTAINLGLTHISCYSLILEEGTPLWREHTNSALKLPDEDTEREMYALAQDVLEASGYRQYEISNFAKDGFECRHNLKYWRCEEYIGTGLAAHSYIDGVRTANTADMAEYLAGGRVCERTVLSGEDMRAEYIIMALRLAEGVKTDDFYRRFGVDFYSEYRDITDKFIKLGLMERTDSGYRLTVNGINVSNSVMCEYV